MLQYLDVFILGSGDLRCRSTVGLAVCQCLLPGFHSWLPFGCGNAGLRLTFEVVGQLYGGPYASDRSKDRAGVVR